MPRPLNALIVEDSPFDADLVVAQLQSAGFDPVWKRIETEPDFLTELKKMPDIILSDYAMPEFTGLRAVELLRQSGLDIPFVLISGTVGEDIAVEAMRRGATDYLLKDRIVRLGVAVEQALEQKRLRDERKHAEESMNLFRTLIDRSNDGINVIDPETGRFLDVNRTVCERLGYTREEMLSMRVQDISTTTTNESAWQASAEETRKTGFRIFESRQRRKDGTTFPVEINARYIELNHSYIVAVVRDITDRKQAEETLQRLRGLSEAILNSVGEGVHGIGLDGRITFENPIGAAMLGYEVAEIIGQPAHITMHHARHDGTPYPQAECPIHATLQDGRVRYVGDEVFWRKDGTCFPVEYTCTPLRDKDGAIIGTTVVFADITERKRAVEVLRESEERFRQLAENIDEVFWLVDPAKHEMLYISPAYEKIWGRRCEDLYASPGDWLNAIHPEDRERVRNASLTKQDNGTYDEVYRVIQPDGSVRSIHDRAFPVRNAAGKIERIAGVARDVTERRKAMEQIREQAALLDKAQDAITVRDLEGRIFFWNKAAERIYGWTREEALAMNFASLAGPDAAKEEEAYNILLKEGEWSGELHKTTKDGRKLIVEARWTLLRDNEGNPKSIFTVATDITERKKIETQFLRAQRMESIGTLAGGVAHDLNNILSPIMMSIEILKDTARDPLSLGILQTIEVSAQRGADIVRQILSFARGMEGKRIEVQSKHLLRDIEGIIKGTFPKNIRWQLSVPSDTWTVLGDPTQLHQILLNLCVNARDAMPDGGLLSVDVVNRVLDEQYATMHLEAKPGPHVVISVIDTGTGMTPDVMEKIFDPFFTTKEIGQGTGLGLSTVLAIVKSHEGFINVYSEPGKGTTFRLHLPAITTPGSGNDPGEQESMPRGNGETILLVDDEVSILTVTSQTLEAFGYRVLTAGNGAFAVATYAQHMDKIAVALVDMMMPVMDGRSTIHALKQINPAVKIIAASGLNARTDITPASTRHFLSKPYTAETLLQTLRMVLDST
ncbi:MAG TPA: PAS domain S-box protein [Chthoniobacteraceae bacterium]|nr:PAS domain S-box protein [Chthoniobacteraceae bacterium]